MNQERIQWSWADFKTTVLKFGKIDVSAVVLVLHYVQCTFFVLNNEWSMLMNQIAHIVDFVFLLVLFLLLN